MSKANYDFEVIDVRGNKVITIVDLNLGGKSVTNDIENIVNEVIDKHWNDNEKLLDKNQVAVVYKDSEGLFNGYDVANDHFTELPGATHMMHAVNKYLKMLRVNSEASEPLS